MIDFIKRILEIRRNPWKRALRPRPQFAARVRTQYLAAFHRRYPSSVITVRTLHPALVKFGVTLALICVAFMGASIYADAANVNPTSPLYALKRSHEYLQMAFVRGDVVPRLHLEFAKRRLSEIEYLNLANPSSTEMAILAEELHENVDDSLALIGKTASAQSVFEYCNSFAQLLNDKSPVFTNFVALHPDVMQYYSLHCVASAT